MSELKSLEFSSPKPRYETFAEYLNDKGQKFIFKASSGDEASLNKYIKNLQVDLEYVSEDISFTPDIKSENSFIEEETTTDIAENQLENNLEIVIESIQSTEIGQAQYLVYRLRNFIGGLEIGEKEKPHIFCIPKPIRSFKTIIRVNAGKVLAELLEDRKSTQSLEVGTGETGELKITRYSQQKNYCVKITPLARITSEYEIDGNLR